MTEHSSFRATELAIFLPNCYNQFTIIKERTKDMDKYSKDVILYSDVDVADIRTVYTLTRHTLEPDNEYGISVEAPVYSIEVKRFADPMETDTIMCVSSNEALAKRIFDAQVEGEVLPFELREVYAELLPTLI